MLEIEKYSVDTSFEQAYLKARAKENRILTIEQIKQLPYLVNHPMAKEWKLRQKSTKRILEYVQSEKIENLLDLGCGNGWLTYKLAPIVKKLVAIDVNEKELKQAAAVLSDFDNVDLMCCDIFKTVIPSNFDLIILNGTVQYFPNLPLLIKRLLELLKINGEIHFLDSPFYTSKDLVKAKARSDIYYDTIDASEMKPFYNHHIWADLVKFNYQILFNPKTIFCRIGNKLGLKESPFPWIKITKS